MILPRKGDVCSAVNGQLSDFDELSRVAIGLRKNNDFEPQSDRDSTESFDETQDHEHVEWLVEV